MKTLFARREIYCRYGSDPVIQDPRDAIIKIPHRDLGSDLTFQGFPATMERATCGPENMGRCGHRRSVRS